MKAKVAILCLLCLVILVAGGRVFYWTNLPAWKARDSRIKWKKTLPDPPSSSPALGRDGTLYVATRGGAVYALDPSGEVRWAYRADLYEIPSGLVLDGDENLYFFTLKKAVSLDIDWDEAVGNGMLAGKDITAGPSSSNRRRRGVCDVRGKLCCIQYGRRPGFVAAASFPR